MQKLKDRVKNACFALEVKLILCTLTSVSHFLKVSNYHICSNDEFDL